ncbi:substrate-binding domain-containing protein [Galbibacter pacificus]|uniref:histidine kinase n=1 Tax=Galbibacter pacificus TaxID=2996052 RepID=A0ABT6FMT7_9FLAO|nr:substrate-binding domain-containing protein [Galbibacter pacificus]MDG3581099.1 substrate-binding domain-containing protein [Galbibacter pacificus]MDG3584577.1 substrate-binding domain-containing protein [Galbibacter pacificus]
MRTCYIPYFLLIISTCISCGPKEAKNHIQVGFAQAMSSDNWRKEMEKGMQVQSSLYPHVKLEIKNANNNVESQIQQIHDFIDERVDVLIVSPIKSKPVTAAIENALKAGIPTIIIDRKIDGNNYTAYIGANNMDIGKDAAKYILSGIKDFTSVVQITGDIASSPARERQLGFESVLKKSEKVKLVATIHGDWEKPSVTGPLDKLLDSMTPGYIFAHNDRMAMGVWEVLKQHDLQNKVKIVGVDGLYGPNGGIQYVKDKILLATILYPTGGAEAIDLAVKIVNGEFVHKNNTLNTVVIDSVNVDLMQNQFNKLVEQQNDIEGQQQVINEQVKAYQSQNSMIKLMIGLLVLLLALALWSIYSAVKISRSKRKLEIINEKIKTQRNQIKKFAQQLKESNDSKINFFTALSHEFKTPLTLITSSVETIFEQNKALVGQSSFEMNLIINNSKRLIRLINELLDFRKLETDSFTLKPRKSDIKEIMEHVLGDFKLEAVKHSVQLKVKYPKSPCYLWVDTNALDKVFFNVLSNAMKFTPAHGKIEVEIFEEEEKVKICIRDTGIGIPQEDIQNIFNPFVQASNNDRPSSGLGLYIAKQFIELHKGTIAIHTQKGTEFIIVIPKGNKHLQHIKIYPDNIQITEEFENHLKPSEPESILFEPASVQDNFSDLLIIEDNTDLCHLLVKQLKNDYNIYISIGNDAIEKALDIIPDIVICDLNLPETSGFELAKKLKEDLRTSHIPVIVLTAMGDEDSYIKAMNAGADFYITKPFQMDALKQVLKTILYNRERLRYYYANKLDSIASVGFDKDEQDFVKKINAYVLENLNNPEFSVEELAKELHISRVQLYRKVKAILGVSISDYINGVRLEKAQELLQDSSLHISEIAYGVGFSSPGYFSTAFKNKYGITPKRYRN